MSEIESNVASKILLRAAKGQVKYGVSMADEILSMKEWLNHLQQELMDAAVYVEKILGEIG